MVKKTIYQKKSGNGFFANPKKVDNPFVQLYNRQFATSYLSENYSEKKVDHRLVTHIHTHVTTACIIKLKICF